MRQSEARGAPGCLPMGLDGGGGPLCTIFLTPCRSVSTVTDHTQMFCSVAGHRSNGDLLPSDIMVVPVCHSLLLSGT